MWLAVGNTLYIGNLPVLWKYLQSRGYAGLRYRKVCCL